MTNLTLSSEEIANLRRALRAARTKREAYRINTLILLGSGWTYETVSEALLLDRGTLRTYVQQYREGGLEALLRDNYQGPEGKLPFEHRAMLDEALSEQIFRTTDEVRAFVQRRFKIAYSRSGMTRILHELGFTYKKPKLLPAGYQFELQESFASCREDFISKNKDQAILYYDSMHAQFETTADYGWIKKGCERFIKNKGFRGRVNVSGAVDMDTLEVITHFPEKVNQDTTIATLKKIRRHYPLRERITVIMDNATAHKTQKVKAFAQSFNINLVYLPPYSPNLNLMERIWGLFRRECVANTYFENFHSFRTTIKNYFAKLKRSSKKLISLLAQEFQDFSQANA